jgi:hypothetical protein
MSYNDRIREKKSKINTERFIFWDITLQFDENQQTFWTNTSSPPSSGLKPA